MRNTPVTQCPGWAITVQRVIAMYLVLVAPGCGTDDVKGPIAPTSAQLGLEPVSQSATTSARATRNAQVAAWVARNHRAQGHRIVRTEILDDGSIVDWVDPATVPGSNAVRPPLPALGTSSSSLATPRELVGPPGTLPFIRPAFTSYVNGDISAVDVDDYVNKISTEASRNGGPPSGNPNVQNNRLYAPDLRGATNFGLAGFVNNFWSPITPPASPDFSFYEMAAFCFSGASVSDLVGIIEGVNPQIYGTSTVWGAESFVNGVSSWITGGHNSGIWHQVSTNSAPGQVITGPSTIGGPQGELLFAIILFNAASGATPGWWVEIKDQWVGYFDTVPLTALKASACNSEWYGEAFDSDNATTRWMTATMGSGRLPSGSAFSNNFGFAATLRQPLYYTLVNNAGGTFWSTLSNGSGPGSGIDPNCYNVTLSTDGGSAWNPTLFFGGPGGGSASCM